MDFGIPSNELWTKQFPMVGHPTGERLGRVVHPNHSKTYNLVAILILLQILELNHKDLINEGKLSHILNLGPNFFNNRGVI